MKKTNNLFNPKRHGLFGQLDTWVGAPCVEMGFTRTFPGNQDVTVKLKSELISIKF